MSQELHTGTGAFDLELALSRVGDDLELLQEIAELFLSDADRMLAEITKAVNARDARAVDRSAHTLKGCVANFGALQLYDAALTLERMGRGGDLTGLDAAYSRVRKETEHLVSDLKNLVANGGK